MEPDTNPLAISPFSMQDEDGNWVPIKTNIPSLLTMGNTSDALLLEQVRQMVTSAKVSMTMFSDEDLIDQLRRRGHIVKVKTEKELMDDWIQIELNQGKAEV